MNAHAWVFNWDVALGYLYGGFTAWALIAGRWRLLTAVSVIALTGWLVDIQRPLAFLYHNREVPQLYERRPASPWESLG